MSNRNFLFYGGVLLGLVALQVGILVVVKSRSTFPTVLVRATNAGVPLGSRAARVTVLARNAPSEIVAEGQAGEVLEVPAGRYDVDVHYILANDRPVQRVADVGVQEGERVTLQVDFSSGELEVDVEVGNADPGLVVTYIYAGGDASRVIATLRSEERALLSAGTYDLRVVLTEASEEKGVTWLRDVVVEPGLSTRRAVAFRRGRPTSIGNFFGLNPVKDTIELLVTDMERIVMANDLVAIVEVKCQRSVYFHWGEVADGSLVSEAEDSRKELSRSYLVPGWDYGVVKNDGHSTLPSDNWLWLLGYLLKPLKGYAPADGVSRARELCSEGSQVIVVVLRPYITSIRGTYPSYRNCKHYPLP